MTGLFQSACCLLVAKQSWSSRFFEVDTKVLVIANHLHDIIDQLVAMQLQCVPDQNF